MPAKAKEKEAAETEVIEPLDENGEEEAVQVYAEEEKEEPLSVEERLTIIEQALSRNLNIDLDLVKEEVGVAQGDEESTPK